MEKLEKLLEGDDGFDKLFCTLVASAKPNNRRKRSPPGYINPMIYQKIHQVLENRLFPDMGYGFLDIFLSDAPLHPLSLTSPKGIFQREMQLAFSAKGKIKSGKGFVVTKSGDETTNRNEKPFYGPTVTIDSLQKTRKKLLETGKSYMQGKVSEITDVDEWEYFRFWMWETFLSSITNEDRNLYRLGQYGVVQGFQTFFSIVRKKYIEQDVESVLIKSFDHGILVHMKFEEDFEKFFKSASDGKRKIFKKCLLSLSSQEKESIANALSLGVLESSNLMPIRFIRTFLEASPDVYFPWVRSGTFGDREGSSNNGDSIISFPSEQIERERGVLDKSINYRAYKTFKKLEKSTVGFYGDLVNMVSVPLMLRPPKSYEGCELVVPAQLRLMNRFIIVQGELSVVTSGEKQFWDKELLLVNKLARGIERFLAMAVWQHGLATATLHPTKNRRRP